MNASDIDWRSMLNSWSDADIRYLRAICDEKLNQMSSGTTRLYYRSEE